MLASALLSILISAPNSFCFESPVLASTSASRGRPSSGSLDGAVPFTDSATARVLPLRHAARCLRYGTARLVSALQKVGARVSARFAGGPPLGVGDIARPRGGSIAPYSRSHQSGRDVDLAFYTVDTTGRPAAATDLMRLDRHLRTPDGRHKLDTARTWHLVRALIEQPDIELQWLFVAPHIRRALLAAAAQDGTSELVVNRAMALLHQPSDAKLHDDHLHVRIRCTPDERLEGCVD